MDDALEEKQAPDACQQSQGLDSTEEDTTETPEEVLARIKEIISINRSLEDIAAMRKQLKDASYIAGRLALRGQITVFFAGPNTGKTLLSLYLISEAIAAGQASDHVYHINLDDTYEGLITKAELALRYGFHEVSPETFNRPADNFEDLVNTLLAGKAASEAILILDTVKKFVDTMDKRASSKFMTTCRRFAAAGGTIIALAHTNKHRSADDRSVPAGTSDIVDDCDCAYTLDVLTEERTDDGVSKTVEFQALKTRGPVARGAVYRYTSFDDGDYPRMFESVTQVDGDTADEARRKHALVEEKRRDAPLIQDICTLLSDGEKKQSDLVSDLMATGQHTKSAVVTCLHRWAGDAADGALWRVRNGTKKTKLYGLIP